MYRSFYNLKHKPFQISTDPRFLWLGEKHKEALAVLKYGILDNKGFIVLTGDVGTGKTTLVNMLLKILEKDVVVATVQDPSLEPLDFFNFVANAFFGVEQNFKTKGAFLISFEKFLKYNYYQGQKVLLIIDEAQQTKQDLLEEIRLLSNIELDESKLLNIFFVGQSEFNNILLKSQNRALRQRITVNYEISPLTEIETGAYMSRRLKVAGAKENMFTKDAIRDIFLYSNGYPRLINILSDRALLTGFVEEHMTISPKIIAECAEELSINEFSVPKSYSIPQKQSQGTKDNKIIFQDIKNYKPKTRYFTNKLYAFLLISLLLIASAGYFSFMK